MEDSYGFPEGEFVGDWTFVLTAIDDNWHAGQPYEETPAKGLSCKKCGGTVFNVGKGDLWTGVRCVTCRYEVCVHEG